MRRALYCEMPICLLVMLLVVLNSAAQEYRGAISGLVIDPKGSVVANATIKATSPEQTYNGKTDNRGNFYIPYVQPGTYTISAEAPGFKTVAHDGVVIDVAAKINQTFSLPVGEVNETVSVDENTLQLNTADASGGTVIDLEKVQNLPLNGRQVYMLLSLTPGVKFTQTQFGAGGYSGTRGWDTSNAYSITGQPGTYNQFMLNGAPISVQGDTELQSFQQRKADLQEEIESLDRQIDQLKQKRKITPHHIPMKLLPEEDRFTRLRTERKHFVDTIKMIAYRAESSMASMLREHIARPDDARALLRQIFDTEADLTPDTATNTLTVRLHHLTQAAHDQAIEKLLVDLNATQTIFPGTSLTLVFKLGSS
jgi:hypothetical protein